MSAGTAIGVVDYGMGNRRSVQKALQHVGGRAEITSDLERLAAADGLVIPGVGAFPIAMENLDRLGLTTFLRERAERGVPVLGICLGMQLLFERSEELGSTPGLGLLAGEVRWLTGGAIRIPHIGWNDVSLTRRSPLTAGLPEDGCPFYHVHSLAAHPADRGDVIGTCEYGERFASIVGRGSVIGVQFHPEKSSARGLQMLENFVTECEAARMPGAPRAALSA